MSDLQAIKDRAKFYKAGAIIPFRVMAARPRKFQHLVTFGSDSWVLPGPRGYIVFFHNDSKGCALRIKDGMKSASVIGSIWHGPSRRTLFQGDMNLSEDKFVELIIETLKP